MSNMTHSSQANTSINEWVISHVWRSHERVLSHIWMSHVTHINQLYHTIYMSPTKRLIHLKQTHHHGFNPQLRDVRMSQFVGLISMCDTTDLYVWRDSFICVTWLFHDASSPFQSSIETAASPFPTLRTPPPPPPSPLRLLRCRSQTIEPVVFSTTRPIYSSPAVEKLGIHR